MTSEEHKRLWELIQNPPPGSKIEAAKRYGVDLTLNLRSLQLTPTERAEAMNQALEFAMEMRRAGAKLRDE
jgi:ribosome-associated translation inhibitor RaiA